MTFSLRQLRLYPFFFFLIGTACLGFAAYLMVLHIRAIDAMRNVSVPIVGQIPALERKLASLQEQVDLTELNASTQIGSPEEQIRKFALPEQTDLGRLMAVFDIIREVFLRDGTVAEMSDVAVGETQDLGNGLSAQKVSVNFALHEDAMRSILLLIRLAGLMKVGDVLTEQERGSLLASAEAESPTGVVALEQFFAVDLPEYARNPKLYEEQVLRSFTTPAFMSTFKNVMRTSLLRDTKDLLTSDIGSVLIDYKLWPLQIMAVDEVSLMPGSAPKWHRLSLKLRVFSAK